jgi:outer membrane protein TolC
MERSTGPIGALHGFLLLTLCAVGAVPAEAQQQVVVEEDRVLRGLVAEALERHPAVESRRAALRAAERRIRPAGSLDDPMLETGVMDLTLPDFAASRSDFTEWDLSLSQAVPWPGTLGARTGAARASRDVAGAEVGTLERELTAAMAAIYYRLRYLATALEILERQRRLLEAALQLSTTRYATGVAPQSDPIQARLARERLASEEEALRGEYSAALAAANALRARPPAESVDVRALLTDSIEAHLVPLPPAESLVVAALAAHPRVASRRAMLEQASFGVRLERLAARPDFSIMVRYGYRGSVGGTQLPDFFSTFVGLRLPIYRARKQSQLVAAAGADSAGAAAALADTERDLTREVTQTVARAEAGRRRLELLVRGVLPAARATVESVVRSYQVGRTEFLTLLAAEDAAYRAELETAAVAAEHLTNLVMLRVLTADGGAP